MSQSKLGSVIETITSVASGFVMAVIMQMIVFPFYGIRVSFADNVSMTLIFTVASIVRGYYIRRFFNWLHNRRK